MSAVLDNHRRVMLEKSRLLHELYEQRKATYTTNNPQATPTEFAAAMRKIADDLGI